LRVWSRRGRNWKRNTGGPGPAPAAGARSARGPGRLSRTLAAAGGPAGNGHDWVATESICNSILYKIVHNTVQYCTILYNTVQFCTILTLYYPILYTYCTILRSVQYLYTIFFFLLYAILYNI